MVSLTQEGLLDYYEDMKSTNNFVGSFEDFIEEYGLKLEKWLADSEYDFSDVRKILFEL